MEERRHGGERPEEGEAAGGRGEEGDGERRPLGKNAERGARYRERDGEAR